ncbi:MAG: TonB-dependent receptor [Opitutaceae bacterium]|nr:TonB-dependent receptor [Opitutaceae bacterium]
MKLPDSLSRLGASLLLAWCGAFLPAAHAQATGTISGQVSNVATATFLEGARVQVRESGQVVFTDATGRYELTLPAGAVTLSVSYTGLASKAVPVEVRPGASRVQNIELTSELYTMEKFSVTGEREGRAKTITLQQQALNVKNVVSADNFGNIANGNIGELLQQIPGVMGVYNGSDPRSVMVRGIDANLNTVTMDGNRLAGHSSSQVNRAFEFEQVSLGSIETIEVTKAPTPDMDADSLGGNVNLVTRSPFDRVVKRYATYSVSGIWQPRYRTRDRRWWVQPIRNLGGALDFAYADRLGADQRLGILLTTSYSSWPRGDTGALMNYQNTATDPAYIFSATLPRPAGVDQIRAAVGAKLDYKLSDRTVLSLNTGFNVYHEANDTRALALATTNAAANFRPGYTNDFQEVLANANSTATMTLSSDFISGRTAMIAPSVRHRTRTWEISYGASLSHSVKYWEYYPEARHYDGPPRATVIAVLRGGLGWTIDRRKSLEWPTITQTAGRDIYDLTNYNTGVLTRFLDKGVSDQMTTARFDARRNFTDLPVPAWMKVGVNYRQQDRESWINYREFNRIGPDRIANTADDHLGGFLDTSGKWGDANQGYRGPPWANPFAVVPDVFANPQHWSENLAYRATQHALGERDVLETVTSGYLMGNVRIGDLNLLGGLRVERTETEAEGPLSTGTPAVVTGRRTTSGEYQNVFPGVHLRYSPARNFVARASYSTSIGRPAFGAIIPLDTINDVAQTVTTANPSLRPQFADNFDVSLEYYFEPVGLFSASVFLKEVKDFQFNDTSGFVGPGADNGFDGQYVGYRLTTMRNGGQARYRGLELSYQQQFTFLPGYLRGLGANLNYTRLETRGDYGGASATTQVAGFIPETRNVSLTYILGRIDVRLSSVWRGTYIVATSASPGLIQYSAPKFQVNLSLKYSVSQRLNLFCDIYNLNREPNTERYQGFANRPIQTRLEVQKIIGGIKGRF